ncbi:MAG: diguanylate cyclase [Epulopiscium sp.]|nr:diguanylate cyclase [Candidatus Epulonipiscium sp.]
MLSKDSEIFNRVDWFLNVFNNISDFVFLMKVNGDEDFRYLFMNESAKSFTGLTDEAIGRTVHEMMPKNVADLIVQQYKYAIEQKQCITYEDYAVSSSSDSDTTEHLEYFESKITPLFSEAGDCTHIIAVVRDITERKMKEKALKESEEKYRLIADNMTDLVSIIDVNGKITYASPSHQNILGHAPENYVGECIFNYIHPSEIEEVRNQFQDMHIAQKTTTLEFRHIHSDHSWLWLEGKISLVLDDDGNAKHFLLVAREVMERKLFEEKLRYLAFHDTLTDLPNRRLFKTKLVQWINEANKFGQMIAVMYLDIDRFKQVNDTLGHDIGDKLLCQFSQRIKACLRKSDILARLGGDEFCILLMINQKNDAINIAKRIINDIQAKWKIESYEFITTSSIGIAFYEEGLDDETLLKRADIALYHAKESGRNTFQVYS